MKSYVYNLDTISKFIVTEEMNEFTHLILDLGRYVDNLVASTPTLDEAKETIKELTSLFEKFSLSFKPPVLAGPLGKILMDEQNKDKVQENIFGICWDLETDKIHCTFELTLFTKQRGKSNLPPIDEKLPSPEQITRHSLSILAATIFSRDGCLTAPISLGLRILLSRACELMTMENQHTPIIQAHPSFVTECLEFIHSISQYKNILPLDRCLIPGTNTLTKILGFGDGSRVASGFIIYLISMDKYGKETINIVRAGSKIGKRSVPVHETISRTLLIEHI